VINFVFGGFSVLGAAGEIMMLLNSRGYIELPAEMVAQNRQAVQLVGENGMLAQAIGTVLSSVLLLASGVGYLRQSRFWGRTLGNAYAAQSIAISIVAAWLIGEHTGRGIEFAVLVWIVYPVLTLILINGTFKEDFIR